MIKKIADEEMSRVTGGITSGITCSAVDSQNFITNIVHDEAWKKKVKEAAEKADSRKISPCVCGHCPGCMQPIGMAGDVCSKCREEAGCPKKIVTKETSALIANKEA
jgi:hypothetical protein